MWTAERILALAPDPASAKAGQGLASPRKWVSHGHNAQAMWGECQGSGKDPYKTQIDLSEPAFKCSCPSRKFPCKHALGLFLMLGPAAGTKEDAPPDWVSEWLAGRGQKAVKKQEKLEKAAAGEAAADPAAQAKRAAERLAKVAAGVNDLGTWLEDLVRGGLAAAQGAGDKTWREPAARLVDAQAPGLARMVREIGDAVGGGGRDGWQGRAVRKVARVHLLAEAFKRLDRLPEDLQADVRSLVGITLKEDELLRLAATAADRQVVADAWVVVGQRSEEDEGLRTQRSWLVGRKTGRYALILEFAFGGQPLKSTLVLGTQFSAELIFYPSAWPLRAMVKSRAGDTAEAKSPGGNGTGYASAAVALDAYSDALAKMPLLDPFPMLLTGVRIAAGDHPAAVDGDGRSLPLAPRPGRLWEMVAIAGGHPVTLFGEWDGESLSPMAVVSPPPPHAPEETLYGLG